MTALKKADAFSRGYCSVMELLPGFDRREARDAIVDAQIRSGHIIWSQVGELLRGAECEYSGKKKAQPSCQARLGRDERRELQFW